MDLLANLLPKHPLIATCTILEITLCKLKAPGGTRQKQWTDKVNPTSLFSYYCTAKKIANKIIWNFFTLGNVKSSQLLSSIELFPAKQRNVSTFLLAKFNKKISRWEHFGRERPQANDVQGEVVLSSVTLMWFVCVNFLLGFQHEL